MNNNSFLCEGVRLIYSYLDETGFSVYKQNI